MKKELFDDNGRTNSDGYAFYEELQNILEPIYNRMIEEGYRHQDVETLITRMAHELTLKNILGF